MSKFFRSRVVIFLSILAIFIQSLSPFTSLMSQAVYAQEATPDQTITSSLTDNPSPTPDDSIAPTPTEAPTPSNTPTDTVTPSPTDTPIPADTQPIDNLSPPSSADSQGQTSKPSPQSQGDQPTAAPSPTILPSTTSTLGASNQDEQLSMVVIKNVSAKSIDTNSLENKVSEGSANLTTDKADYAPTDTALITGSSLLPNTTYSLTISSSDEPPTSTTVDVTSNDEGIFVYAYQLDGNYRPNYSVELKDTNGQIVATTTFTDSATSVSATLNGGASVTVGPGDSITAAVTATAGSANADKWKGTGWLISTTPPGAMTCQNTPDHTSETSTESFSITAPTTSGTYNAYFKTFSDNGCSSDPSSLVTLTSGVVVQTRDLTATKTNSLGGGNAINGTPFTWTVRVANQGVSTATFANNKEVLKDEMPNTGVNDYGVPSVTSSGTTGTLSCAQSGAKKENLTCKANGTVTLPTGSYFDISVTVNPSAVGTLTNPRSGQTCAADTGGNIIESDETNNTCSDLVTVVSSDSTPPTTTDNVDGVWHKSNVTVTLTCTDNVGGSGCDVIYWTTDGSTPTTSHYDGTGSSIFLTTDGIYTIKYFSKDLAGNSESIKTATNQVKIDKTDPVDSSDIHSTSHTISVSSADDTIDMVWTVAGSAPGATDNLSGVAGYSYEFSHSASTTPDTTVDANSSSTGFTSDPLADGSWYFHLRTKDNAGNWTSTVHVGPYIINTDSDLTATKTNNVGSYSDGSTFQWNIHVENTGVNDSKFNWNQVILTDDLPIGPTYGSPSISESGLSGSGSVSCSITTNTLTCIADGSSGADKVIFSGGSSFDVNFDVTPSAEGTLSNPAALGICEVDPDGHINESNDSNNSCSDTVIVDTTAPVITVDNLSTTDHTPQLTGAIDDNSASINITVDGNVYIATNNGDGTWTLADDTITPALSDGIYDIKASATDTADNVGNDSTVDELVVTTPAVLAATTTTSVAGTAASAPVCNDTKPGSAPTLLSAVGGLNSVTLTWSQASDPVSYYLVTYGTSSGAQTFGNPNVGGKGTTSYTINNLSGGITYYFKVRAGNGCAPGDYSSELSAFVGGGLVFGPAAGFESGVLGVATPSAETTTPSASLKPSPSGEILGNWVVNPFSTIIGGLKPFAKWILLLFGLGLIILFVRRRRSSKK